MNDMGLTAHKSFLTILVRKVTAHHPHDLRLRLEPLLLIEITIGLDHWHMTMMTWVGTAPHGAFLTILVRKVTAHHPHDLRLEPLLLVEIMIGLDH